MANFPERGIFGRVGCASLAAIKATGEPLGFDPGLEAELGLAQRTPPDLSQARVRGGAPTV